MSLLDPTQTTVQDICTQALKECGALGVGQTALAEDITDAWARLQWMLQQWERKRWLVYHLVTLGVTSTGKGGSANPITVGPGGDINTNYGSNPFSLAFNAQFGGGVPTSARPDKIEAAFLRQLVQSSPNQVDYPLGLLQSMEDYSRIALKSLQSFPGCVFYDPAWPLGNLFVYPVPKNAIYAVLIVVKEQLPISFPTLATKFALPYEYYNAMLFNLALRLRPKYQLATYPGDPLAALAKDSLNVLRGANTAIARLSMPPQLVRDGIYNPFSDRNY